ncbi:argininosuccinate synthase [Fusarium albosuccineum]|uniref:Argininosuccinate synthase n=1 Tax=Fusarium albosuccineum TaxID=1237068 RepID=A0A8H4PIF2_9HYPO|nr:argininosuccinate synthase [Fusarium albosuccineum]
MSNAYVLGRFNETGNMYSETEASMDSLGGFSPEETSGFFTIQAIQLEKYGAAKIKEGSRSQESRKFSPPAHSATIAAENAVCTLSFISGVSLNFPNQNKQHIS